MELYKIRNRENLRFILTVQYINVFIAVLLFIINSIESVFSYVFFSYYLILSFVYITFLSVRIFALFSAFNLFLLGYFIFQVSALFVSLDTLLERNLMNTFFMFSEEQINITLCSNLVILHSMFLGCLSSVLYLPVKNNKISSSILNSDRLQKWGYFIFCFFLPFTLFKFFMEIKLVLTEGYYAYYTSSLSIPFFISISRFFFEFGFFIFLSSLPSKKKFLSVSKIYLLVISLFFLIGVRNRAVLSFLFVLWFYYRFYANKPPKLIFMLSVAVVCIVILLLVQLFRQSGVFLLDDNRSIFNYFFYAQSTNFYILPLLQYYNLQSDIPFVFAPILHLGSLVRVKTNCRIGSNCTMLPGVVIGNKHLNNDDEWVIVGDNCYLGLGAKIFGSVKIGNNVTIGANSVVTKDIPDNAIVGGIPAKIIRFKGNTNKERE